MSSARSASRIGRPVEPLSPAAAKTNEASSTDGRRLKLTRTFWIVTKPPMLGRRVDSTLLWRRLMSNLLLRTPAGPGYIAIIDKLSSHTGPAAIRRRLGRAFNITRAGTRMQLMVTNTACQKLPDVERQVFLLRLITIVPDNEPRTEMNSPQL